MDEPSFPRKKPRSFMVGASYRAVRLLQRLIGRRRMTVLLLDLEWLTWRLAYEGSYELIGASLPDETYCVTPELLAAIIPPGGTVLDVGCGFGRLCEMASPYASRVLGIDTDADRIRGSVVKAPNVELRAADVMSDMEGEHFDVVILAGVLEHLDEPISILRHLRDQADVAVVEVPDVEADPLNLARRRFGCRLYSDDDHLREYTPELLSAHLIAAGWNPVRWERRGKMVGAVAR